MVAKSEFLSSLSFRIMWVKKLHKQKTVNLGCGRNCDWCWEGRPQRILGLQTSTGKLGHIHIQEYTNNQGHIPNFIILNLLKKSKGINFSTYHNSYDNIPNITSDCTSWVQRPLSAPGSNMGNLLSKSTDSILLGLCRKWWTCHVCRL